ncbi:MAG: 60S ribosomal protein L34 [Chaenotheca gracillima]|nr:MAG: 60S ribosomal protein L34 [Chaenotheca gracillima]
MNPPSTSVPRQHERTPSPVEAVHRQDASVHKSRKYSTGGGRAWSEEEEVYLLQTRLQKMPYKHIAAHLRKTELACRLHYHQLSNGTNRRKRTVSISSVSSAGQSSMITEERAASPASYASSAPTTPENNTPLERSPVIRQASIDQGTSSVSASPEHSQKPLLPRPTFAVPQFGPAIRENLRLDCNVAASRLTPIVDRGRLKGIYDAHRVSFWKMIAADYGEGVSPDALEELWRINGFQASAEGSETSSSRRERLQQGPPLSALPPSVTSHSARGFSPINSSVSSGGASSASAQAHRRRSYFTLPTPSTAATPASSCAGFSAGTASIANILNESADAKMHQLPSSG